MEMYPDPDMPEQDEIIGLDDETEEEPTPEPLDVESLVRKARLPLDERQMAIVLEAAPYVLAMADRVRRSHDRSLEPCNVFRFPGAPD